MIKLTDNTIFLKAFSIGSFVLILISLLIIESTPASTGYELSIYGVYPWYFWGLMIIVLLSALVVSLNLFFEKSENKIGEKILYVWSPSFLTTFIILILPYIRGYPIYGRGDVLTHIGRILDIVNTYHLHENGYPLSHILVTILHYTSSIDIYSIIIILPAIFTLLYLFWMLLLGKSLFDKLNLSFLLYLFVILIFILKFERIEQFSPFNLSLFLIPIFLYLLYKKSKVSFSILFVIIIFSITFYHIFVGLTITLLTFTLLISNFIKDKKFISKFRIKITNIGNNRYNIDTLLLVSTIVITWAIFMYIASVGNVLSWIFYAGGGENIIQQNFGLLNEANLNIIELIYTLWSKYTIQFFFFLFPILLLVLLRYKKLKVDMDEKIFQTLILFISFIAFSILFAFSRGMFSYDRVLRIVAITAIILTPFLIYKLYPVLNNKKIVFGVLTIMLAFLLVTNVFVMHKSPITFDANQEITYQELDAAEWALTNFEGTKAYVKYNNENLERFIDALYGRSDYTKYASGIKRANSIETEFGYNNHTSFNDTFELKKDIKGSNKYMIIGKIDILYHEIFFKRLWDRTTKFSPDSFTKLNEDHTASEIYDNGEVQSWHVNDVV